MFIKTLFNQKTMAKIEEVLDDNRCSSIIDKLKSILSIVNDLVQRVGKKIKKEHIRRHEDNKSC